MFAACPREIRGGPPSILRCFSICPPPSMIGGERFLEPTPSDRISLMEKERDLPPPPGLVEGDLRVLLLLILLHCSVSAMQENWGWR